MIHKGAYTILLLILSFSLAAQSMNKDSLIRLISKAGSDSNKVLLLNQLAFQYEQENPSLAKQYYRQSMALAQQVSYPQGITKAIGGYTYLLNMEGVYDSSAIFNLRAVAISRNSKDTLSLCKALFNTGTSYRLQGNYTEAVKYYEEGKNYFQKVGNDSLAATGDDILQCLYYDMHQYEKGRIYGERAVAKMRTFNNPVALGIALNNLGINYIELRLFDKGEKAYREALAVALATKDRNMELIQYLNLGDIELQSERYKNLYFYFSKALALAEEAGLQENKALALQGLSYHYKFDGNYTKAKALAEEALQLTLQYKFRSIRKGILLQLSNVAYAMQDPRLGNRYSIRAARLEDSLMNEKILRNTQELETRYETARKETKINILQQEKQLQLLSIKNKNMLIIILSILALSAIISVLLLYRNHKHRRKLQQLRISELETEKQLAATEAVLKGEEQERARMAKDLHDGLGGMLSGVKFSLHTMRGNLVMTSDNALAFERSLDMLDSSIGEMRRIAHNMLPEALITFGLDNALNGLCQDIEGGKAIQVRYQSVGLEQLQLAQNKSITIYRIIQELLNNILKHAGARNVIVQLIRADSRLDITVEDDGSGFNFAGIQNTKGIGWRNIQNRVELLNGRIEVDTAPGRGTSVQIEIQI